MPSANSDSFTFPFKCDRLFIYSSCLIDKARTCNIMLTKSVKNEHPIIILDLTEKGISFSFKHDVCCGLVICSLSYGDIC